jgi:hypothetical protein
MPVTSLKPPDYKPPKESVQDWDTWRKGWNELLRENEIDKTEMAAATNIILEGSGVPKKRWGTRDYFLSAPSSSGYTSRFIFAAKDASDNQETLAMTDWGYLVKKSGMSYSMITGASWPSGSTVEGTQLGDNVYLVSTQREMTRYNFTDLVNFATISIPTNLTATNLSGASSADSVGYANISWRVTAVGKSGGETLASTPVSLASMPQDLAKTTALITWNPVSAASGDLVGYNVYRGPSGDEKWVGGTDVGNTTFYDYGNPINNVFRTTPLADTTGGPKAKYIIRFQDRLVLAGIDGQPTKVLVSGRWPDHERFDWYGGGGDVLIEPDSGQNITGLGIHQEKLVVFKENSVWQVLLNVFQAGQYFILDPQYKLLTASQGCSSHRSIVPVENDLMFANRRGIYILRYEPQLLTILNANEISAKIRPYFENLTEADHTASAGAYLDKRYILSFPNKKESIVFDRERLAFTGPWVTPFGIRQWAKYVDSNGMERWAAADANDAYISEMRSSYTDDKGEAINTLFRTKKEDFGDWTLFKTINELFINLRSVVGTVQVNIYIEERSGNTILVKSFTVESDSAFGLSGWGTDVLGNIQFGDTADEPETQTAEIPRKTFIYKTARSYQVEIRTSGKTDNYELLGITTVGIPQSRGNSPSSWNV